MQDIYYVDFRNAEIEHLLHLLSEENRAKTSKNS